MDGVSNWAWAAVVLASAMVMPACGVGVAVFLHNRIANQPTSGGNKYSTFQPAIVALQTSAIAWCAFW